MRSKVSKCIVATKKSRKNLARKKKLEKIFWKWAKQTFLLFPRGGDSRISCKGICFLLCGWVLRKYLSPRVLIIGLYCVQITEDKTRFLFVRISSFVLKHFLQHFLIKHFLNLVDSLNFASMKIFSYMNLRGQSYVIY